ncbi:MAG: VOC family protein [Vicinamibacterales bacterium]|nr:hypothetical protein [Acidobacteriota bacterium]MDP7472882.1 VOC family protein [Vicinamibacterales bacterium]MDP7672559.1 VOC family protein [Vicinamibacterales bacterium]HJO39722.1 VOC family protein [Vicinamibacterales bacterium]
MRPERTNQPTRRDVLAVAGALAGAWVARPGIGSARVRAQAAAVPDVDHLIWGVADRDAGIDYLEALTGVRAVVGGSHPGRGTRNGILSMGHRQYIEILAPDPEQPEVDTERIATLRRLATPRLLTWCAVAGDADTMAGRVGAAGVRVREIRDGARERPDGVTLRWRNLYVEGPEDDVIPYAIEWAVGTPHPSSDAPLGGSLQSLRLQHPEAARMSALLAAMGLGLRVEPGPETKLAAVLDTPRGEVVLQ